MIWVKKRTGKLVPVFEVQEEDPLRNVGALAKLREAKLTTRDGRVLDTGKSLRDLGIGDGDTLYSEGDPIFDHVHFERPDGKRFRVAGEDLLRRDIKSIKEKEIAPRTKVDPSKIKVFIGCIPLEENKTLYDYNIEYGEYLRLQFVAL